MNKISTKPSKSYYKLLKGIARYLRRPEDWGIKYKWFVNGDDLATVTLPYDSDVISDKNLPLFLVDVNQTKLMAFVDAAYANHQRKQQSTTGFVITYCNGAIIYHSKTQSITAMRHAISSTEVEFLATVSCAKITLYLQTDKNPSIECLLLFLVFCVYVQFVPYWSNKLTTQKLNNT